MKVSVIGIGHVGLVTAAALARWGHDVTGMDDDAGKVSTLEDGGLPFHEPDLRALIDEGVDAGRLRFTTDARQAVEGNDVIFVCVGTPSLPGGGPNLSYVEAVGRRVAAMASDDVVLVEKSTVPANTGQRLAQIITHEQDRHGQRVVISVASNPEFLREGTAVVDTLHPDRIVIGASDDWALQRLREVYAPVVETDGCPVVETDVPTAELIKHASNGFLATRISFMNQVARICERVGADVATVAAGMGHDARIGPHFLRAGLGYGGSCFPKDVDAFIHLARNVGEDFTILEAVRDVNASMLQLVLTKLRTELWHLDQKLITILGAAFKPGTDDLREAPAMNLARALVAEGATVRFWDPVALPMVAVQLPEAERIDDIRKALEGAHAVVVATEWDEVGALSPQDFLDQLAYPIVIDARNVFDPARMRNAGLLYHGIGR